MGGVFDDHASDASSSYDEIPRYYCVNGTVAARWNLDPSHPPSASSVDWEISRMQPDGDSNASDASSEYPLVSSDLYFDE